MVMFLFAYPYLEAWVTGDKREHHLLDRPRNAPTRTAIGVAALTFYTVLTLAAGADIIAVHFDLSMNDVYYMLRFLTIFGPPIAFVITKRVCLALQRRDREIALHGVESGRIVRTADGEYFEVHDDVSPYDRWNLVQHDLYRPLELEEGAKHSPLKRLRAKASRFYFEDRIEPVTPAELAAAHHHGHDEEEHPAIGGFQETPALGESTDAHRAVGSGQA
jgi:ubiquinol-cytochrome c reductase cytochrome b subunit